MEYPNYRKNKKDNNKSHCPFCGEDIDESAKKCKHCGEWLNNENTDLSLGLSLENPVIKFINGLWIFLVIIFILLVFASGDTGFIFIILIIFGYIGTFIYMLPSIYASSRNHPQFIPVLFVNLLFRGTIIGWIVAMVWACTHRIGRHTHW